MLNEDVEYLKAFREKIGTSRYDAAVKKINRQRLEVDVEKRQKRVTFKWSKVKKLYDKCRGVCWWCENTMPLIRGDVAVDHFDPNEKDFGADSNLGLLHSKCNGEKGGKSLSEQAQFLGITLTQLIQRAKQ